MAGRNKKPMPRCKASLKDGSPCRTWAQADELWGFPLRQREEHANTPIVEETAVDESVNQAVESTETRPRRVPVDVRAELAADASTHYDLMVSSLLECLDATKTQYYTCKCGKRNPVEIPDATARVKAVETLLNQGLGRPQERKTEFLKDPKAIKEAFELLYPTVDQTQALAEMSDEALRILIAGYPENEAELAG
jgi:hypothetical protein